MTQTPQDTPSYLEMLMRVAKANERTASEKARADAAEKEAEKHRKVAEAKILFVNQGNDEYVYGLQEALIEAEAREQQLKEAINKIAMPQESRKYMNNLLSTLYPDTPAPKEGSHEKI